MCLGSNFPLTASHPVFRAEHAAEWPPQAAHEGPLRGVVSHGARAAELAPALSAHVDGPLGVGSQWVADVGQPRPEDSGVVCGQPAARLPLWPHPAGARRAHAGKSAFPCRQQRAPGLTYLVLTEDFRLSVSEVTGHCWGRLAEWWAPCSLVGYWCSLQLAVWVFWLMKRCQEILQVLSEYLFCSIDPLSEGFHSVMFSWSWWLGKAGVKWLLFLPGRSSLYPGEMLSYTVEMQTCKGSRAVWPPPKETEQIRKEAVLKPFYIFGY